jgi:peptidoglycan/LPS O-acetylase OafA/YrhL
MKNNFNLMRLIAALTVVFSHSYALLGTKLRFETVVTWPWLTGIGGLAVHVFFAISGYLITKSFVRAQSFPIYIAHRALRIFPGLICAVLFSQWLWTEYDGFTGNPVVIFNAPLWTLGWEVYCYIGLGVLGVLGVLNRERFNVVFAGIVILYVMRFGDPPTPFRGVEPMIMFFVMGAFIAVNEQHINMKRAAAIGGAITFCAFAPFIIQPAIALLHSISPTYLYQIPDWKIHNTAYIFSAPFFIIYLGAHAKAIADFRTDISYGVYIYGWPIGEAIVYEARRHGIHINGAWLFFVSLPPVLVLAFASWKLIEEPALKLKRLMGTHKPTPAPEGSMPESATL